MNSSRCAALALLFSFAASASTLKLTDFNLFVGGNLTSTSEVDGRTLIGGNLAGTSNYGIKPGISKSTDSLIVGGVTGAGNYQVNSGSVRLRNGKAPGNFNMNGGGSVFENDPGVTAMAAEATAQMKAMSSWMKGLAADSAATPNGNKLLFEATPGVDNTAVFDIDGSMFSANYADFDLSIADPSITYIFNVKGAVVNFTGGNMIGNLDNVPGRIVWNLYEATTINVQRGIKGTLLAPKASLTMTSPVDGSVFVGGNLVQNAEVHLPLFTGALNPVPEPSTMLLTAGAVALLFAARRRFA